MGLATANGWRVAHCRKVLVKNGDHLHWETTMPAGWPDLVLVRHGVLVFAELKSDTGSATDEQKAWAHDLKVCPCHYYLWRPKDWPHIHKVLTEEV